MTEKRFKLRLSKLGNGMITDTQKREDLYFDKEFLDDTLPKTNEWLNELAEENEQLKQYKQSVNDVLKSWSQKNLTAKQLQVVLAIMEELNVIGDVE